MYLLGFKNVFPNFLVERCCDTFPFLDFIAFLDFLFENFLERVMCFTLPPPLRISMFLKKCFFLFVFFIFFFFFFFFFFFIRFSSFSSFFSFSSDSSSLSCLRYTVTYGRQAVRVRDIEAIRIMSRSHETE